MKRTLFPLICILAATLPAHAYVERNMLQRAADPERLADVLATDHKWVEWPDYTDRAGWDALLGGEKAAIVAQGERRLDYEWQVVKLTDYLDFARTGTRTTQDRPHNANIGALTALFMAEMVEGEGRFIDQIANGVFHLCEMTTWSNSAHLSLQRVRGAFPNADDHVIELVSGDVAATLSWIHYFLGGELDKVHPLLAPRLAHEIERRILTPYLEETRFWWMATDAGVDNPVLVNNWNPWCNANVLQCFLLVERDRERLLRGVYKTMVSVDKFINYTKSDGACEEGPSYWGHAAGKLYDYLQVLHDATGGAVSIFSEPIMRGMGEYISRSYVGDGWVVNFADASARGDLDYRLIYRYGAAVGSDEMERFASYLRREFPRPIAALRDTYRTLADLSCEKHIEGTAPEHTPTPFTWYPETEFCYMSAGRWFFAAKGGYNDESHNHNDIGGFSLYADSQPVMIDVGVGTYTAKTFSSERYTIPPMQSDYHNLPRINGVMQAFGRRYAARGARADERRKTFSVDIAGAYPAEAGVKSWVRGYRLSNGGLEITDDFDIDRATAPNRLNFMTWGEVDASRPGVVEFTVKGKTCRLAYNSGLFTVESEHIPQDDTRLSRVWGERITRITLVAKDVKDKGTYRIWID